MLKIVFEKMINNKWLFICLLIGCIFVVSLVSSIPIYNDGILQKMLTEDLEQYQLENNEFPGNYQYNLSFNYLLDKDCYNKLLNYKDIIENEKVEKYNIPILEEIKNYRYHNSYLVDEKISSKNDENKFYLTLESMSNLEEHIKITKGRIFSESNKKNVYETIMSEKAIEELGLILNRKYLLGSIGGDIHEPRYIIVTGIFTVEDSDSEYWFEDLKEYNKSIFIKENIFLNDFLVNNKEFISEAIFHYSFDYHEIGIDQIDNIINSFNEQKRWVEEQRGLTFEMPSIPTLIKYLERQEHLKTTLWVLIVPVLIMLAFYTFMISGLIVRNDRNEIALLKSRGAGNGQIFQIYLYESLILCGISLPIGIYLGFLLTKFLGAANGFLEFANRSALPIRITNEAFAYSLLSLLLFIISMLIPAFFSSRTSIVLYKQKKTGREKTPLWKKTFLDIIILAISIYGLYRYKANQDILQLTDLRGTDVSIDPLLFLISTFFILGIGMVFLRIYPLLLKLLFFVGKKVWSPVFYAALSRIARASTRENFIMMFIIISVAVGILSANQARTINRNIEDKIYYRNGSDIVITPHWDTQNNLVISSTGPETAEGEEEPIIYIEPEYNKFANIEGIESVAKVYKNSAVKASFSDTSILDVSLMAIETDDFGKTAWFREDLLEHHWYEYLNLIAKAPRSCLVSKSFQDQFNLKKGDNIVVNWKDYQLEFTIYAFIDFWPSINPYTAIDDYDNNFFIVGNLGYMHNKLPILPYEIWLKKQENATDREISEHIIDNNIRIEGINYSGQELIIQRNDPMLQGTNGMLTLGFIITMIIATIGFVIYWILSIKERQLQFGIFRAMGLTKNKVLGILFVEQILVSLVAILIGILIGNITSEIFVPLIQMVYSAKEQVPPFKVISKREDYVKIYIAVLIMLTSGFLVIRQIVSGIRIDKALKLGED